MRQTLSSYHIFHEVAKCGSISKAANTLYISQPAISKSIRKLEDEIGLRLFIRNSKGVTLTQNGELLYEHTKTAFEALGEAEEELHQLSSLGVGLIRIGVSSTLCKFLLLPYLKKFIADNPHIRIRITCQGTNETLKMLEDNKLDIGLIGKPDYLSEMIFFPVEEIEDIFVATDTYLSNLSQREPNNSDIFETATLMLLDKNNMTRQYIDDYFTENRIQPRDYIEVSNMDLLIEFARIGVGIACVIQSFVTDDLKEGRLQKISLDIPIHKRWVGFSYKPSRLQNPALKKFVDYFSLSENELPKDSFR